MRIILGATTKVAAAGGGPFFCPACKSQTNYTRQRVSRYFTFFFIPLFPIRTLGEYIRCGACHAELRPEVAKLTREQIEQAMAPWVCPACQNHNGPMDKVCLSCGAAREQGPPPMPGQPAPVSAAAIMNPPPLAGQGPQKKMGCLGVFLVVLGGFFAFYVVSVIALNIWARHYRKHHPKREADKPGLHEFEAASKTIANNETGLAHGNTPEAQKLATSLAEGLGIATKKVFAGVTPDITDGTDGRFIVFCQLTEDTCVFLVHVPSLRHFDTATQHSFATLCYGEALLVLKAGGATDIRRLAVATRGTLLYDSALIGSYPPQTPAPLEHLEKLTTEAWDVPGLYPFFAPKTDPEKEAPETPTSPTSPTTPATPAASENPDTAETSVAGRAPIEHKPPPSWVPLYPDLAKPAHGMRREENGVLKGRTMFETADPLDKVKEFYENRLKSDGFEITTDKSTARIFENAEIAGRKEDGRRILHVAIHQMKARTNVVVTYEGLAEIAPEKPQ